MALYITLFRILLTFPTAYLLYHDQRTTAFILMLVGILSDWLDGNVARKNKEESKVGALLDPLADKIFVLSLFAVLLYKNEVSLPAYILLLLRELLISFLRSLAVEKGYTMKASYLGKAKAFFEFLALLMITLQVSFGHTILWLAVLFAYASAYDYVIKYLSR